jgi:hypothetical protein
VWVFIYFDNSWVQVIENKKFKEFFKSNFLFLKDSKNHSCSGLRNPKRGGYEVGAGVRV